MIAIHFKVRKNTMPLQTDTYYRGYRLSLTSEGGTHIWSDDDLVDTVDTDKKARAVIDSWHNAR